MPAYIFLCDLSTEQECWDRRLFGTSPGEAHRFHYSKIAPGNTLFLYNLDTGFLRGPFKALTACLSNLEPAAWKTTRRSFPWQVRVDPAGAFETPIGIDEVGRVVPVSAGKIGMMPPYELSDEQAVLLLAAFAKRNAAK